MTKDITLKAACADVFHYPAEWDPSRGTLDEFQRKRGFEHHFGKSRTKNLLKGALQIRFEMPFKVQCLRCQTYIGQGTRYDADKKKVGKYLSSPIYEFAMHCGVIVDRPELSADYSAHCNQRFVIRTDPKGYDYELAEGLRRKVETWSAQDSETIELVDPETRRKMQNDPMFRAEKTVRDARKERSEKERLADLQDLQDEREDTYGLNCMLRRSSRVRRKEAEAAEEKAKLEGKPNFSLALEPPNNADVREARAVNFRTDHDKVEVAARRAAARAAPLLQKRPQRDAAAAGLADLAAKRRRVMLHRRMAVAFGGTT